MMLSDYIGQNELKVKLEKSIRIGRIPHAQLFVGKEGRGALSLAIAYASEILSLNKKKKSQSETNITPLSHPDLHFVYPVVSSSKVKSKPLSKHYLKEWLEFVSGNLHGTLNDWYHKIDVGNKQGMISVHEADEIIKKLSLKSFEGGYKVLIIWMAEKMNIECANKLLKFIEEPSEKTVLLLLSESDELLLSTIKSRCQNIYLSPLSTEEITANLINAYSLEESTAFSIAKQSMGNMAKAVKLITKKSDPQIFERWFINWVRSAFRAKKNKAAVNELIRWSEEIAKSGREIQKEFLAYAQSFFRQAVLKNYGVEKLVYLDINDPGFRLENFAPFINGHNINEINTEIELAAYHIERNGNAKIVLTDLSIKLTRLLHQKKK